jgi:hypothetical protein
VEYVKQEAKIVYLLECLQKTAPPVLIFCENKADVDDIHEYLLLKVTLQIRDASNPRLFEFVTLQIRDASNPAYFTPLSRSFTPLVHTVQVESS